VVIESSLLSL
jgi:hypothetical protein